MISSELLERPAVRRAIDVVKVERSQRTQVDAEYVLKRLHDEIEADLADLYDPVTGALLPAHTWPPIWRKGLVQGIDVFEERDEDGNVIGFTRKVRLSDRVRRLELIGKHVRVNAFQDVIEHKGLDKLAERLARAKQWAAVRVVMEAAICGGDGGAASAGVVPALQRKGLAAVASRGKLVCGGRGAGDEADRRGGE